jgi:hypothetical protein
MLRAGFSNAKIKLALFETIKAIRRDGGKPSVLGRANGKGSAFSALRL